MSDETRAAAPRPGGDAITSTAAEPAAPATGTNAPAAPPGYELLGEIGSGGMGVVYRARDLAFGRDVAVKLLHDRYPARSVSARRFLDEARITGQLQHPGIPAAHQVGTLPDERPFLVMRLIKGRTLEELLASGRRQPAENALTPEPARPQDEARSRPADAGRSPNLLAIFEQVCQAVGYAHARDVIHRDLKPANVMVGSFGEVQVMDWGLAKVLTASREPPPDADAGHTEIRSTRNADAETQAGSLLGTPAFMPPEQAVGAVDQVDKRSDVFGLGALLCVLLTGKPPYVGDAESTRQLAARGKLDGAFARLANCGAEPELIALCQRCLSAEKAERPADAGEVATAVAGLRAAADERARRAEVDRERAEVRAAEQRKRRRVQLALAVLVGLMLCAGGAVVQRRERRVAVERERRERNADAVASLLGQCEEALRADDAAQAALTLAQADERATDGGTGHLTDRFTRCRTDLKLLHGLEAADAFRWTPVHGPESDDGYRYPSDQGLAVRWRTIAAKYAIRPDETPPAEVANRVSESLVRDRLLGFLDQWLVLEPKPWLRATLHAADPDPYRGAVRDAIAARDRTRVAELAGRPEALRQPAWFAAALGRYRRIAVERRRQILEVALRGWPGNWGLLIALGTSYPINQRAGADERVRWFQAAAAVRPRDPVVRNNLACALENRGDREGAIAAFKEAIRLDPKYVAAYGNLGSALSNNGDLDEAIATFRKAIHLRPKSANNHGRLGSALRKTGDLAEAIAEYRKAIRLRPKSAATQRNLGIALRLKGDLAGAITAFEAAIRLGPRYPVTHYRLGLALRQKGDSERATAAFEEGKRLAAKMPLARRTAHYHYNLGLVLFTTGDLAEAIAALREAIRLDPKSADYHNHLGFALKAKGDLAGAIAEYRVAIRLRPKYAVAHRNLGSALRQKGDLAGAIAAFREAVRLDPKDVAALNSLAWVLAAGPDGLRDGKRAVELATRACELSQWKNPYYIGTLAAAHAEAGDFVKAIEYEKKAIALWRAADRASAEQRLALYARKQPYRDPALAPREVAPPPRAAAR
jgi:tetratricopeptide (TPR) repeat protein/tRNA A-37 threonylcarbamoyl transferase component Bud32